MNTKNTALALLALGTTQIIDAHAADEAKPEIVAGAKPELISGGMWGYPGMRLAGSPPEYAYGVSMYSTAWPLLEKPISGFQIGLCGTWIMPDNRGIKYPLLPKGTYARDTWEGTSYDNVFQTIEGSLGFWGGTRFGSTTAKFRMNGTANGYTNEISSPGWGFGDTKPLRADQGGIAQISQHLLVPPDGLTFKTGTTGDLFGYAWMALPLTQPMTVTDGLPVPTGDQTWTMFANTANFKGPVACYLPTTWSRIAQIWSPALGRTLDVRPANVGGGAIEINTVPRFIAKDPKGEVYTRIPTLQFPVDEQNRTVLMTDMTRYSKSALWNQVQAWIDGGAPASGKFEMTGGDTPKITANNLDLRQEHLPWEVVPGGENNSTKLPIKGIDKLVSTVAFDDQTFGLQWNPDAVKPWPGQGKTRRGDLPSYYRRDGETYQSLTAEQVPDALGLKETQFAPPPTNQAYTSPTEADNFWNTPGPKSEPFTVKLNDGSIVTYRWYRFIDQPTVVAAGFTLEERERLQAVVEKIHREWTPDKDYLPAPSTGKVAALDTALFVTPPQGMEVGYVPIVTRQADK